MRMKPGRELDSWVFEKVMGWVILLPGSDAAQDEAIPPYSTDIAAAWQVGEKMATGGWRLTLEAKLLHRKEIRAYTAEFERLVGDNIETAGVWEIKTAPMAICLAALKAVGEGNGNEIKQGA